MGKFKELATALRGAVQNLVNDTNVEAVAGIAKTIDSMEVEYETAEKETKEAKNTLVKYVKDYAFKEKPEDNTGVETPPTLDDAIAEAFKEEKK